METAFSNTLVSIFVCTCVCTFAYSGFLSTAHLPYILSHVYHTSLACLSRISCQVPLPGYVRHSDVHPDCDDSARDDGTRRDGNAAPAHDDADNGTAGRGPRHDVSSADRKWANCAGHVSPRCNGGPDCADPPTVIRHLLQGHGVHPRYQRR